MIDSPYLLHHLLFSRKEDHDSNGRSAIIDGDRMITYGEFKSHVDTLARHLAAAGVNRGDRIGIFLPKCVMECVAIFAASRADAVFVPINPVLRPAQVKHILDDCGARAIVSSAAMREKLGDVLDGLKSPATFIDIDAAPGEPVPLPVPAINIGEDLAAILYTSGSTGLPKGVMLSHRNLVAGTRIVRTYLEINSDDRILSVLPFSFDYGLNQLLTAIEQRATIVLFDVVLGDKLVRALADNRITGLAGVPMIWALLTRAAPSLTRTELPHLRYITNTGGAVPSATVQRLRELLPGTDIYLMYGLTEAFRSTYLPPEEIERRPTSIGKAVPETEVFVVTPDGRRAAAGEQGILVHRGPTVSLGYWNRPDDTAQVLKPNPLHPSEVGGDIVCFSGDLAVEDGDGYLYFVARDDNMIKSTGHRISPTEVEEALMATGALQQAAVIGLPDEWLGQRVHAVAVARGTSADANAILQSVAETLPTYMLPGQIELVPALPFTSNGKIDYKLLVAERSK